MARVTRWVALSAVVVVLALSGACGGQTAKDQGGAKAGTADGGKPAAPKVVTTQRWPRYWATIDAAETGASDALHTAYFAGYDDTSIVYTGQDVIRFLDRKTGKQRKQQVLKGSRLVCSSQPRRQLENGLALIVTGTDDVDDCDHLEAYDAETGALKWAYGADGPGRPGRGGEMTVDQRDGVVLFAMNAGAGEDSPGILAGIDAATGRELWRKQVPDFFFGRPAKKKDECFVNPAIAADRPVVIAFLGCDDFSSDKLPGLYGIDLKTGEQLWTSDFWEKPDNMYTTDGKKVRPHTDDGRVFAQSAVSSPVFVDSETGEVTKIEEPAPRKIDGSTFWWPICDDFRGIDYGGAGARSDDCFFASGKVDVFVREMVPAKNTVQLRVQAVETKTGKPLWTWDRRLRNNPKKYDFHYLEYLGWNSDRSEFWVLQDQKDVIRLDAKTGERVGQGLAAPPMELVNFAIAGPKFVLTRTAGGITNPDGTGVKSGTNYYVTDAD